MIAADVRLDAERLRLVCRAVVRTPLGVLPATAFMAYIMTPYVGAALAWGWMAVLFAIWCARAALCAVLLRRAPGPERVGFWIRFQIGAAMLGGLAGGAAAFLFHDAPDVEYAYLTMVVCGWCAAGLAVSGAVPAAFYGFVVLFLAPLTAGWALSDHADATLVAILLLLFIFLLTTYARDNAQLVGQALRTRFENEELVRQLQAREGEAQAARERAEAANLSKSAFLAAASHDLRQPLHALSLLLSTLQERTREPEASSLLAKIATSADSLDKLFKGLLDLSRLDAGSVKAESGPVALGPLLRRLENDFRPLAEAKGLAFACAATDAWVASDQAMLERLLRNLLDNAVKYTERGRIEVGVEADAANVRVKVSDTGIGIDDRHRERIFEEYYQIRNPERNRRRGIGLGLAIVKKTCELLGHAIRVESALGRGSSFELGLERCAKAPSKPSEDDRLVWRSTESLRGLVVVVVDDDIEVQEATRTLLEGWACRPIVCASSSEALRELERQGLTPEAVLADYRLAGAENGLDAIGRLYQRYGGDIPAAVVTGEINAADLKVPDSMPVVVMQKPLRASDVRDWLLLWKSAE
ncbi:MAG TPA: hybrid sensor histidine kinase/response regulator [Burkholderiales bacterium]